LVDEDEEIFGPGRTLPPPATPGGQDPLTSTWGADRQGHSVRCVVALYTVWTDECCSCAVKLHDEEGGTITLGHAWAPPGFINAYVDGTERELAVVIWALQTMRRHIRTQHFMLFASAELVSRFLEYGAHWRSPYPEWHEFLHHHSFALMERGASLEQAPAGVYT